LDQRPLGALLHLLNEPGDLSQWLCLYDSSINIVLDIIIMLASLAMSGAMTSTLDFNVVVGMKSSGDNLLGSERTSLTTSSTVTGASSSNKRGSCRLLACR